MFDALTWNHHKFKHVRHAIKVNAPFLPPFTSGLLGQNLTSSPKFFEAWVIGRDFLFKWEWKGFLEDKFKRYGYVNTNHFDPTICFLSFSWLFMTFFYLRTSNEKKKVGSQDLKSKGAEFHIALTWYRKRSKASINCIRNALESAWGKPWVFQMKISFVQNIRENRRIHIFFPIQKKTQKWNQKTGRQKWLMENKEPIFQCFFLAAPGCTPQRQLILRCSSWPRSSWHHGFSWQWLLKFNKIVAKNHSHNTWAWNPTRLSFGDYFKKKTQRKVFFWDEIVELSHVLCQVLELEDI